jgi:hypothetical protein
VSGQSIAPWIVAILLVTRVAGRRLKANHAESGENLRRSPHYGYRDSARSGDWSPDGPEPG